jgi:2-polyprenyl-3-methyl-5-hydroxy-6-metoxy-1,4-benzoquinol methylase
VPAPLLDDGLIDAEKVASACGEVIFPAASITATTLGHIDVSILVRPTRSNRNRLNIMKKTNSKLHCCPSCRAANLELTISDKTTSDSVTEGAFQCGNCHARFPIRDKLPRFVPASNYAESFGFQWNLHAQTQLDSHSGLPISHDRLWTAVGEKSDLTGQHVLEAGSGAGRFTEVLVESGANVVSFDYSTAVDANANNQKQKAPTNLHLFQGDIFNIPLHESSFDKVICLGVIQHTPDPERAFESLARYVRPGGQLVVDIYASSAVAWLHWKYLLRPITRRLKKETLYRFVEIIVPPLVPVSRFLRRIAGRAGGRLMPIVEYSHLGLPPKLNVQWAILDTFDMYSPAHDHPQTLDSVVRWFRREGFVEINVRRGLNGVVGSGRRPSVGNSADRSEDTLASSALS